MDFCLYSLFFYIKVNQSDKGKKIYFRFLNEKIEDKFISCIFCGSSCKYRKIKRLLKISSTKNHLFSFEKQIHP